MIATPAQIEQGTSHDEKNYLNVSSGFASWAFTLDHKRIGIMYLVGIAVSLLLGGIFALLVRLHLWYPAGGMFDAKTYNEIFTLHGAIMVFLFIIPSVPASLGNFFLPIMLGAKDVAFPRMNLASFYLWVIGAIFFVSAMLISGLDTGWTFYTPYSVETSTAPVVCATMGVFILGFSSIFTGLNFVVTVNTMRPPGMTWFRMPLFLWSLYATGIIQLLATPVLGITVLLLGLEATLHIGIFDPKYNGDPVLFQHFFWFYSHPAVYIMILPAMGVVSELLPVYCRKHIFGYKFIALSSVAIALLGFLVWGHHMFVSSQSALTAVIFSGLTFSVAIPSGIKVFNWLATMYKGNLYLTTGMCYVLSFLFLFTIGGLTGLHLGSLATDVALHDTYFVVAHFHYVMMGGSLIAFIAALFHWWPKMFGKMYNETWGRISALLVFVGFNLTFFPQFLLGSLGMPRRYASYEGREGFPVSETMLQQFTALHRVSTTGAMILGVGLFIAAGTLIAALYYGRRAPRNPWGGATLEWTCQSPPIHHNFHETPTVGDPYIYANLEWDPDLEGYKPLPPASPTPAHEQEPVG
ncbi:cbb3-type cytochrome c oxidase subunit I [Aeoliella sp. ICT_H6.2]|uniref:Cbb3-type cytochrome c oxidase subunit I n=1 Tax=Aeoliella straminimaris TaxID=2954799 RepID=A0A9X2JEI5_9BACT|nr:cbb3-type cytochrome c oxidase subunit I [Aeoliella straminimaris]MCO6043045.1 cbb3-type cytochrome c oxidase subunit I [Aeoliella straminimaris]